MYADNLGYSLYVKYKLQELKVVELTTMKLSRFGKDHVNFMELYLGTHFLLAEVPCTKLKFGASY